VKTYIVQPSTVWGIADNAFAKKGLQRINSIQIPWIISTSVARGVPVIVGPGLSLWPHIHIDDTAELYYKLFDAVISGKNTGHGREGYYFAENGEYTLHEVCIAVGISLYKFGKVDSDGPVDLTLDEREKYQLNSVGLGTNSRARGERSRLLGWNPTYTTQDLIAGINVEVEYWLKTNPV
jgi:nucleoside-diphosphate-sugar epimerase